MSTQNILDEILGAELSDSYVRLREKIAELEEKRNSLTGFFWKRSSMSAAERAKLDAEIDVFIGALRQVEVSMFGEAKTKGLDISVKIN